MSGPQDTPKPADERGLRASATAKVSADEMKALARLGADLLRRAEESQPAIEAAWDELMASWGVQGDPVGVARLRKMIQQDSGDKPPDNDFTRELIALREERRP